MNIKQELYKQCVAFVEQRLQTIQNTIGSNQKALQSETKSSAGDKHETGRAMLQLEMEKAGQQLASVIKLKEVLDKISPENDSEVSCLGSLIRTSQANYYLAISAGKLTVSDKDYFAVSPGSPIGNLLLGKKANDEVQFNGKTIKIVEVL